MDCMAAIKTSLAARQPSPTGPQARIRHTATRRSLRGLWAVQCRHVGCSSGPFMMAKAPWGFQPQPGEIPRSQRREFATATSKHHVTSAAPAGARELRYFPQQCQHVARVAAGTFAPCPPPPRMAWREGFFTRSFRSEGCRFARASRPRLRSVAHMYVGVPSRTSVGCNGPNGGIS